MTVRPDHLPDFTSPPLNEVVLGVQFATPRGYQQIYAGEVWNLFRSGFPLVEELPPIPPMFETFGLPAAAQVNFGFVTGASHDRFWFLSPGREQLIQFQHDRLLHNWRKVGDQSNEYPRFEKIVAKFEEEVRSLETYFQKFQSAKLNVNQCEISYINHILAAGEPAIIASEWLRFVDLAAGQADDLSVAFRRTITDSEGKPQGRLTCEVSTAVNARAEQMLVLTLTARGAPQTPTVESALEFLVRGRDMVVSLFAEITTDSAHRRWGRVA